MRLQALLSGLARDEEVISSLSRTSQGHGARGRETRAGALKTRLQVPVLAIGVLAATGAFGCQSPPPMSPKEYRRSLAPMEFRADCSFDEIGGFHTMSGGPAHDLGEGRVWQDLGTPWEAIVSDCNTRQSIILSSPIRKEQDVCGPVDRYAGPLAGPGGYLTLREGKTLSELAAIAGTIGARVTLDASVLNRDPWGKKVPRKRFVNLFCGCKLYYPDSPGAKP